jgi:streptomycin 6-kinase
VGDPAYDGGTLLKSRVFAFLEEDEPDKAMLRGLDIFADAAEVDPERVRRWAQYHAVAAAFWARRHGFHGARGGAELGRFTQLADHAAQLLTSSI